MVGKNRVVLIVGCQRSGTTVLNLVLDSHPSVRGVDEMEFRQERMPEYLYGKKYHPCVSLKLPMETHLIENLASFPRAKALWSLRDPRGVVASMLKLQIPWKKALVPWTMHPEGCDQEIRRCSAALSAQQGKHLVTLLNRYKAYRARGSGPRSREGQVFGAALCWLIKQRFLTLYESNRMAIHVVRYENLVTNPGESIAAVLDFLHLPWHDDVLRHHELHSGVSVGETNNERAIDAASMEKWRSELSDGELAIVEEICSATATSLGYDLSSM